MMKNNQSGGALLLTMIIFVAMGAAGTYIFNMFTNMQKETDKLEKVEAYKELVRNIRTAVHMGDNCTNMLRTVVNDNFAAARGDGVSVTINVPGLGVVGKDWVRPGSIAVEDVRFRILKDDGATAADSDIFTKRSVNDEIHGYTYRVGFKLPVRKTLRRAKAVPVGVNEADVAAYNAAYLAELKKLPTRSATMAIITVIPKPDPRYPDEPLVNLRAPRNFKLNIPVMVYLEKSPEEPATVPQTEKMLQCFDPDSKAGFCTNAGGTYIFDEDYVAAGEPIPSGNRRCEPDANCFIHKSGYVPGDPAILTAPESPAFDALCPPDLATDPTSPYTQVVPIGTRMYSCQWCNPNLITDTTPVDPNGGLDGYFYDSGGSLQGGSGTGGTNSGTTTSGTTGGTTGLNNGGIAGGINGPPDPVDSGYNGGNIDGYYNQYQYQNQYQSF